MISILAIGNSFTEDATTYLHQMATAANIETKIVNLYVQRCTLEQHYHNMLVETEAYKYQLNGGRASKYVSIQQALSEHPWSFVVLQQASQRSGILETYEPFLSTLKNCVLRMNPEAQPVLHETWAYEYDSRYDPFRYFNYNQKRMEAAVTRAAHSAASACNIPLIPTGDVIAQLRKTTAFNYSRGGQSLCRDGYHLNLVWGRYAAAATWLECLLDVDILGNTFRTPDMQDESLVKLIQETVHCVCTLYRATAKQHHL